eukprot:m.70119 g.70119  ORF g.70119 m.70119 type:complete len:402 (-) comp14039_c0_seq5:151-1356(-)
MAVRVQGVVLGVWAVVAWFWAMPGCAQLHAGDWPQFGRSPTFQSFNDVPSTGITLKEWTADLHGRVIASPAVAAGSVIVGSDRGVTSFDQVTGAVQWNFPTDYPVRSSPAIAYDGSVVFGSYTPAVFRLDAKGRQVWRFQGQGTYYAPVTLTDDGAVLIGSQNGPFYKLNFTTGAKMWEFDAPAEMNSGAARGQGDFSDIVVMRSYDHRVYGISYWTGESMWTFETGDGGGSTAVVVGDTVFVGSWDAHVYALRIRDGSLVWKYNTGGQIESHPAFHNGIVYASAEESHAIFALNASTGALMWKNSEPAQECNGSPSISRDLVYVGCNDQYLYALNPLTGKTRFRFLTCANVFASPAIADSGMVFAACNSVDLAAATNSSDPPGLGQVYAINPSLHLPSKN